MSICDTACKAKIILNGGRVRNEISLANDLINHLETIDKDYAYLLIEILDEAEDKLIEWNRRMLDKTGYKRKTERFLLREI